MEFFNELIEKINNENLTFYLGDNEFYIYGNNKLNFYDFTINEYKIIIEFNGSHIHPNKNWNKEKWDNWKHAYRKTSSNIEYKKDKLKINLAIKNGYKVFIIFDEDTINEKKEKQINKIINYIKKNYG